MIESILRFRAVLILAGVLCGVVSGCAWSVGGQKGGTTVNQPTQGQELIDLQRAHEGGAITDEEYARMKARIIEPGH